MAHAPAPTDDRLGAEAAEVMTSREMTDDACWRHLNDTANGRVVLLHHGRPLDVPVNHVVDGRTIVFRTGAASPLGLLPSREPVRFEVDDASTSTGWNVLVAGEIERVEAHARDQIDPAPAPWAPGRVEAWMRIVPTSVTGLELTRPSVRDDVLSLDAVSGWHAMRFERIIVVADEFTTSDRPFALARRLAAAANLAVEVLYGVLDTDQGGGTPGWRLQRRLDAHGLSAAELLVLRAQDPALAVCEHLAGHDGSLILRSTSAGGHDGGPLLDRTAEGIMSHVPQPLLLLGPQQANPRRDDQLSPITIRDGASELTSLESATERWISTFTNIHPQLVDVIAPDPWPPSNHRAVDNPSETPPRTDHTELRTLDLAAALLSHLDSRHDAVVVVSSPRWPSTPSHWWATARRLVRQLSCPVLVVPAVGQLGHAETVELRW